MEVLAINSRPVAAKESSSAPRAAEGASFLGSVTEAVKAGKLAVAGSTEFARLDLLKNKFGVEMPVEYQEESDEERIFGFLAKIRRILEENSK